MNKAKEKAKELIDKFTIDIRPFSEHGHWDELQGKQCALLCVEELIKDNLHNENIVNGGLNAEYWQEVKKEIELL